MPWGIFQNNYGIVGKEGLTEAITFATGSLNSID